MAYADGSWKLQVYGSSGRLLFTGHSSQGNTRHVYLGSRLIAEDNTLTGTSYSHTDALGSPVARTNSAGQVTSRTRYEPYGATAAGTNPTGIGFTGHVNDADTGLVYMQQRYYEPLAGRFLSVDPVVTDANGGSFNRYLYANGNPYLYVDPDGRQSKEQTPSEKEKEKDKKKAEEAKGVRYVRTLWRKGDEGSPESNSQGLSNTAGDHLGIGIFRLMPGVDIVGCFAGACTYGDWFFAGLAVVPQGGAAATGLAANPFMGKTAKQIAEMPERRGYVPRGPDPVAGRGTFVNPQTGRGYHIDANHPPPKGPHVGVHRPRQSRDILPPRDYPIEGP